MLKLHYNLEKISMGLVAAIIVAASIGGIVKIAPLFTIDETVELPDDLRPHTPLELAGREIYIREGCYACHSQMVRSLADELDRYGPYSLASESASITRCSGDRSAPARIWRDWAASIRTTGMWRT